MTAPRMPRFDTICRCGHPGMGCYCRQVRAAEYNAALQQYLDRTKPARGTYEWDQSNDPYMINKTIPCPVLGMTGLACLDSHIDGWGLQHLCERNAGHTGRHFTCNWKHDYIVAVWK